ncbi:MAG: hypothetical protein OEO79_18565, partial [Gemmatimonadota bacterium]|nr:hypothetical protein [Gemmatimonadota bacterium]
MTIPTAVVRHVETIVGPNWVRTTPAALETYAADALPTKRCRPGAVVIPGSRDEVARVVAQVASRR